MYKVIKAFCDLQDGKSTKAGMIYHSYKIGDTYPRDGLKPTEARIAELAGPSNAQGVPLIAETAVSDATERLAAAAKKSPRKTRAKKSE